MDEYLAVIEIQPDADAHRYLANLLVADGQVEEAIRQYRLAIEARPESFLDALLFSHLTKYLFVY